MATAKKAATPAAESTEKVEATEVVTGDGSGTALPPIESTAQPSEAEGLKGLDSVAQFADDIKTLGEIVARMKQRYENHGLTDNEIVALRNLKQAATLLGATQ